MFCTYEQAVIPCWLALSPVLNIVLLGQVIIYPFIAYCVKKS